MKSFGNRHEFKHNSINKNNPSIKKLINRAIDLHFQGNIKEAIKHYQYLINQGVADHSVFSNYGGILKSCGKLQEAELSFRKALELNPNFANAYSNLGNVLRDLGQLQEAEKCIRRAIKLNPKFADAFSNLGNVLLDLGKLQEAELSFRKALELNPNFANAYNNLGTLYKDLGKLQEAELSFRKAIKLNPNFANAYCNLGNVFNDLGILQKAEMYTSRAIELNPNSETSNLNLAYILSDLGKLDELTNLSKSIIQSSSINEGYKFRALIHITIAYLLKKNFSETFSNLNKIKELEKAGIIKTIKNEINRKHASTFSKFLSHLYPLLQKENANNNLKVIPHIGESHCLSFSHQIVCLDSTNQNIQPVLITGGKAWHFANKKYNRWKDSLNEQLKKHNYSDKVFISFGEIDCRKEEGILTYTNKQNKTLSDVCEKTINEYLNYMEITLSPHYSKRYYFGVPAPIRIVGLPEKLDLQRIELIKLYNSILKTKVLLKGSYFLDVYQLTSDKNGENNNFYMCDYTHLSPKCLSILFQAHLCKP